MPNMRLNAVAFEKGVQPETPFSVPGIEEKSKDLFFFKTVRNIDVRVHVLYIVVFFQTIYQF